MNCINCNNEATQLHPHPLCRKTLPDWLFTKAWSQANEGNGIPTIVVGKHNSSDMFAIINFEDLVKLIGENNDEDRDGS